MVHMTETRASPDSEAVALTWSYDMARDHCESKFSILESGDA